MLQVPLIKQAHNLSCEAAALAAALQYKGTPVSEDTILGQIPTDLTPAQAANAYPVRWGDPYNAFIGDVNGRVQDLSGYGVYFPPVQAIANRYGAQADGNSAWTLAAMVAELRAGNPVIVWASWHLNPVYVTSYTAYDGRRVWFSKSEHAQVLAGYNPAADTVTLLDPIEGDYQTYSSSLFMSRFQAFDSEAVVIRGHSAPPAAPPPAPTPTPQPPSPTSPPIPTPPPSPTPTATPTPSPTPTATPTPSPKPTATPTPSPKPTATPTPSPSQTAAPSP